MFVYKEISPEAAKTIFLTADLNYSLSKNSRMVKDLTRLLNDEWSDNILVNLIVADGGYAHFWHKYFDLRIAAKNLGIAESSTF